jgi:hypothetical protein
MKILTIDTVPAMDTIIEYRYVFVNYFIMHDSKGVRYSNHSVGVTKDLGTAFNFAVESKPLVKLVIKCCLFPVYKTDNFCYRTLHSTIAINLERSSCR